MVVLVDVAPALPETPRGVEPVLRRAADGAWCYRFRTRYDHPLTGKRVPVEFDTIEDVLGFRAQLRLARARGEVAQLSRGDRTLAEFVRKDYWPRYARRQLAQNTRGPYWSV